jgi:hypothetical protein
MAANASFESNMTWTTNGATTLRQTPMPDYSLLSRGNTQQIVGRERRERVSQLMWCGGGCFDSRRRVNSNVRLLVLKIVINNTLLKPVLIGNAVGVLIGLLLVYISASAFANSESTALAQIAFPYALAFDPTVLDNHWIVLGLALIEFPLYGIILAATWPRTRLRAIAFVMCVAVLVGVHFTAVREAHIAHAAWREPFVKWE